MVQKPNWPMDLALTTHVFQFQDQYHEALIAERIAATSAYAWGISELEWDLRALGSGQVALRQLRAIMPDGTPLACDPKDAATCAPRSVRDLPADGSVIVHVGIPRLAARAAGEDATASRYVKERVLVPDFANGSEPVELEWLRPRLSLHLEGERLDSYTTLPCARVVRIGAGVVGFDPTFVPPVLTLGASSFLDVELRRVFDGLAGSRLTLKRLPTRDGNDGVRRWLLSLMNSFLPRIADVIEQRAHPHRAYLLLAEMVGALSAFTPQGDAKIPPFDFDHLGPVFAQLFASLRSVIDVLGAEQYRRIALSMSDPTTLYADLREPGIFRKEFYLGVAGDDVERLRQEVPQTFKVASWSDLARVISTHSKGVTLRPEHVTPAALPDTRGVVYFLLEKNEAFAPIFKTGELGIHHAALPGVREVALYAVEPVAR
jgi:type VI secretion system protein ImpJ